MQPPFHPDLTSLCRASYRRMPGEREPLGNRDNRVESDAENARDEDRRPRRLELRQRDRRLDLDTQRLGGSAEVIAHDCADHREYARNLQGREDKRQAGRDAESAIDRNLTRRIGAHQLDRLGIDGGEASQRVHQNGQEAEDRRDDDLRPRAQQAEPGVRDRCEGDDRDGVRRDRVGHQRSADALPSGEGEPDEKGEAAAEREPCQRLLEGEPAGAPERAALVPERAYHGREPRQQEALDMEDVRDHPLPGDDPEGEDCDRREPVASAPADAPERPAGNGLCKRRHVSVASSTTSSAPTACRRSRTSVTSSKNRGSSRVSAVRGCGRSTSTIPVIRPGRADITATRVERNTASWIECVTKITVEPVSDPMRSSVDFPQPEGPISETKSPRAISRSMSCSAVTPARAKVFERLRIETTVSALMRRAPARGGRPASRRRRP